MHSRLLRSPVVRTKCSPENGLPDKSLKRKKEKKRAEEKKKKLNLYSRQLKSISSIYRSVTNIFGELCSALQSIYVRCLSKRLIQGFVDVNEDSVDTPVTHVLL